LTIQDILIDHAMSIVTGFIMVGITETATIITVDVVCTGGTTTTVDIATTTQDIEEILSMIGMHIEKNVKENTTVVTLTKRRVMGGMNIADKK